MKITWGNLALVFVIPCLVGCTPLVDQEQIASIQPNTLTLQSGETAGQTFVAHHSGLAGIDIFLTSRAAGDGEIRLRLRADPQSSQDLVVASLSLKTVTRPNFYRFSFAPQSDSRQHDYYLLLEIAGAGRVQIGAGPGESYLDGASYHNGTPLDTQLTFRLVFDGPQLLLGFAGQMLVWVQMLLVGIFLYILPGWALLLLWPGSDLLSWGEKLGLASGLSLALYPLLLLWTDLIRLHIGPLYAWLPALISLAVIVWRNRALRPAARAASARAWRCSAAFWPDVALIVTLALIGITRFLVIGSLDYPMWGDSYQHTLIAQVMVAQGGLFSSWQPYADLQTFTYHFGFHAALAVFHWFSGLALPQTTLWAGQMINGLAAVVLYPLAVRLGHNRWAGVAAVLLAGLAAPMPMFYVNWGRYTQLAGQVILPVAIYLVWWVLESRRLDWRMLGLAWIALAGLALTHYRVLIFGAPFFIAFALFEIRKGRARTLLVGMLALVAGAGLLYLPWFLRTIGGQLLQIFAHRITTAPEKVSAWLQQYNAVGDLSTYLSPLLWLLLLLSIGWGLWRRERDTSIVCLWWFLVVLAVNPQWIRLPGEGILTNFALGIAVYIPAGLIVGAAVGWLVGAQLSTKDGPIASLAAMRLCRVTVAPLLVLLAVAVGVWCASLRLADLQVATFALVTRPDMKAANWIREHTPQDARFLVNSFFAFEDSSIVGSDGGWWLPLLAGRPTTLPPLNYSSERGSRPDYREWINALSTELLQKGIDHPDLLHMLHERGITYVYIGQRQGRVNYGGPYPLRPEQLRASSHFRQVYHQDRVWVFEMVQ